MVDLMPKIISCATGLALERVRSDEFQNLVCSGVNMDEFTLEITLYGTATPKDETAFVDEEVLNAFQHWVDFYTKNLTEYLL